MSIALIFGDLNVHYRGKLRPSLFSRVRRLLKAIDAEANGCASEVDVLWALFQLRGKAQINRRYLGEVVRKLPLGPAEYTVAECQRMLGYEPRLLQHKPPQQRVSAHSFALLALAAKRSSWPRARESLLSVFLRTPQLVVVSLLAPKKQ